MSSVQIRCFKDFSVPTIDLLVEMFFKLPFKMEKNIFKTNFKSPSKVDGKRTLTHPSMETRYSVSWTLSAVNRGGKMVKVINTVTWSCK